MNGRELGPQEDCLQCGESRAAIKESQRKGGQHQLYCATVDYWGECDADWDRHKFMWTKKDQRGAEAEEAYWKRLAEKLTPEILTQNLHAEKPAP